MTMTTLLKTDLDAEVRRLDDHPASVQSALRRIVHDHVSGWGIVLSQSPQERRRKKRIWDQRSSVRHAFCRPVQLRRAMRVPGESKKIEAVTIQNVSEEFLVRDLSDWGIGLTSDHAPQSRLVVLSFDTWQGKLIDVVVWLRWRKRIAFRSWRCGGSILGVLAHE